MPIGLTQVRLVDWTGHPLIQQDGVRYLYTHVSLDYLTGTVAHANYPRARAANQFQPQIPHHYADIRC